MSLDTAHRDRPTQPNQTTATGPDVDPDKGRDRAVHAGPMRLPPLIRRAAAALAVPLDSIVRAGGATGHTWSCDGGFMRLGTPADLHREVVAMEAASTALPVPEVLEAAEFDDDLDRTWAALLLTRLPGRPVGDTSNLSPHEAMLIGEACGRIHARLATVPTPQQGARSVLHAGPPTSTVPSSEQGLLHLDLHPWNVLVDDAGEVSGVVDWSNAAIGPQILDRARSWSVMTLDPSAVMRHQEPAVRALLEGWSRAAGWAQLSPGARIWACEYMLVDLAARYPAAQLEDVRRQLAAARSEVAVSG